MYRKLVYVRPPSTARSFPFRLVLFPHRPFLELLCDSLPISVVLNIDTVHMYNIWVRTVVWITLLHLGLRPPLSEPLTPVRASNARVACAVSLFSTSYALGVSSVPCSLSESFVLLRLVFKFVLVVVLVPSFFNRLARPQPLDRLLTVCPV